MRRSSDKAASLPAAAGSAGGRFSSDARPGQPSSPPAAAGFVSFRIRHSAFCILPDTDMDSTDNFRQGLAVIGILDTTPSRFATLDRRAIGGLRPRRRVKEDPRADIDDDGDMDTTDNTRYAIKDNNWPPQSTSLTVAQAFSDVGNPFMFQGRPHFALDTAADATEGKLMLNDHRARFNDPVTGRWMSRDLLYYNRVVILDRALLRLVVRPRNSLELPPAHTSTFQSRAIPRLSFVRGLPNLFEHLGSRPTKWTDIMGLDACNTECLQADEDAYAACMDAHAGPNMDDWIEECEEEGQEAFENCVLNTNTGCPAAPPAGPDSTCCVYPSNATYLGANLRCFCFCAGTSPWSNAVRACLACYQHRGCDVAGAHQICYEKADQANYPGGRPWVTLAWCWATCAINP